MTFMNFFLTNDMRKSIAEKYIDDLKIEGKSINRDDIKWKIIVEKNITSCSGGNIPFTSEYYFRTKKEALDTARSEKKDNTRIEVWKLDMIL